MWFGVGCFSASLASGDLRLRRLGLHHALDAGRAWSAGGRKAMADGGPDRSHAACVGLFRSAGATIKGRLSDLDGLKQRTHFAVRRSLVLNACVNVPRGTSRAGLCFFVFSG